MRYAYILGLLCAASALSTPTGVKSAQTASLAHTSPSQADAPDVGGYSRIDEGIHQGLSAGMPLQAEKATSALALVETESTATFSPLGALASFVAVPGAESIAEFSFTLVAGAAAAKMTKLVVAKAAIDHAVTVLSTAIFGLAASIATLNVPGIILSVASIISHITSLIMAIRRFSIVKEGIELQDKLCEEGAPLAEMRRTLQWLLQQLNDKANEVAQYEHEVLEFAEVAKVCDPANAADIGKLSPEQVREQCSKLQSMQQAAATAKMDLNKSIKTVKDQLEQLAGRFDAWSISSMEAINALVAEANGAVDIDTGVKPFDALLKGLVLLEEFMSVVLKAVAKGVWKRVVCAATNTCGEEEVSKKVDQRVKLERGSAAPRIRWSNEVKDFVELQDLSSIADSDSKNFHNTMESMLAGFRVTADILDDIAEEKPFYAMLDLAMISRFGVATVSTPGTGYTGPVFLSPASAVGATKSGEGGWLFRTEKMDDRLLGDDLYTWRRRNNLKAAVQMCKQMASFETQEMYTNPEYAHTMTGKLSVKFSRNFIDYFKSDPRKVTLFSLVPDWDMTQDTLRELVDAEKNMVFGKDCTTRCLSIHKTHNPSASVEKGDEQYRRALGMQTKADVAAGGKVKVGIHSQVEKMHPAHRALDFETIGTEEAKLCTNNLAEALAWYCTLANIGIDMLAQVKDDKEQVAFMAVSGRTTGGSAASHLPFSSVYTSMVAGLKKGIPTFSSMPWVVPRLCAADRFTNADARLERLAERQAMAHDQTHVPMTHAEAELQRMQQTVNAIIDEFFTPTSALKTKALDAAAVSSAFATQVENVAKTAKPDGILVKNSEVVASVTSKVITGSEDVSAISFDDDEAYRSPVMRPRPPVRMITPAVKTMQVEDIEDTLPLISKSDMSADARTLTQRDLRRIARERSAAGSLGTPDAAAEQALEPLLPGQVPFTPTPPPGTRSGARRPGA